MQLYDFTGGRYTKKMLQFVVLVALGVLSAVTCLNLPDFIQSCSRNDPELNACALKSAQNAIKQFSMGDEGRGLPPLDPLFVEELVVYVPNENGLKLVYKDNYFSGLSNMKINDLKFDLNKKQIIADTLVNLDVKSQYDLSGKLLIVPVKSNGDATIKLKNTVLHIRIWYDHVEGDDGKIHWKINKHDIKYEVEKASFRLENLLNDKNIGDQVNKLLNDMWKEIVAEVGPTLCKSLASAVVDNVSVLLDQVPYDALMPE